MMRLRNADFLLPAATELNMVQTNGDETVSKTEFSACHEFLGESTLKFDAPEAKDSTQGRNAQTGPINLPTGQTFGVALLDGIDTGTAAAGDPVRGRLTSAIHGKRPKVDLPVGTPVNGRILRLEHLYGKPDTVTLVIRLEAIDLEGIAVPFAARSDNAVLAAWRSSGSGLRSRGLLLGRLGDLTPRGEAVFHFQAAGEHYLIKSGLESRWVTVGK